MSYRFGVEIDLPFEAALERTLAALQAERLGLVSDVDVAAVIKAKLGRDIGGYRILGACSPTLALRAIDSEPQVGALLPCNLVVRRLLDSRTAVDFMDPIAGLGLAKDAETDLVAAEAHEILTRVAARLQD